MKKQVQPRPLTDMEIETVIKELASPLTHKEKVDVTRPGGMNTICARLRLLYNRLEKDSEAQKMVVGIIAYAKRMNSALRNRNGRYDEGWYQDEDREGPDTN